MQLLENKAISKRKFFEITGLKRGFLDADKLKQAVSDHQIAMIFAAFPDINLEWLVSGIGQMFKMPQPTNTSDVVSLARYEEKVEECVRLKIELEHEKEKTTSLLATMNMEHSLQ